MLFLLVIFALMGIVFISLIPLTLGYAYDVFFPAGEGQINGTFNTMANVTGLLMVIVL